MQQLIRFAAFALAALLVVLLATPSAAQERAEGQSKADYLAWLSRDPGARAQVLSFKSFLEAADVDGVVPTWQLVRTASAWRDCGGPRFEVAPAGEWVHIADTLRFVKAEVEPVIGDVQPVSGFRNAELNACAGGAKASAHRHFYALDLVPVDEDLARAALVRDVCRIHDNAGRDFGIGLGFYSGMRFHLDSKGFRRWGANGSGATSPCATGDYA
jgi:hypothetical protein